MVKDAGDKLPAADRQPIESAIEELKKAIEKNDVDEMKRRLEALNTAQHKAAETMYRTASASAAGRPVVSPEARPARPAGQAGMRRRHRRRGRGRREEVTTGLRVQARGSGELRN